MPLVFYSPSPSFGDLITLMRTSCRLIIDLPIKYAIITIGKVGIKLAHILSAMVSGRGMKITASAKAKECAIKSMPAVELYTLQL